MAYNYEIPTRPGRPFIEQVPLPPYNDVYLLKFRWNKRAKCWVVDFFNQAGTAKILAGVAIVTGADLLEQFVYMRLGRWAIFTAATFGPGIPPDDVPTFTNLGIDGHLYLTTAY